MSLWPVGTENLQAAIDSLVTTLHIPLEVYSCEETGSNYEMFHS